MAFLGATEVIEEIKSRCGRRNLAWHYAGIFIRVKIEIECKCFHSPSGIHPQSVSGVHVSTYSSIAFVIYVFCQTEGTSVANTNNVGWRHMGTWLDIDLESTWFLGKILSRHDMSFIHILSQLVPP